MIAFGAELPIALLSMFGWICPISDLGADGFERLTRVESRLSRLAYRWRRCAEEADADDCRVL